MTETHNVFNAPELFQFRLRNDGASVHAGFDCLVDAHEQPALLQPGKQIGDEVASAMASNWPMVLPIVRSRFSAPGCVLARSSSHASRGMIQRICDGATPFCSSQRQASIPVLPEPTNV
jgi:hypothetical protein